MKIAKLASNGQIVEIMRVAVNVGFDQRLGWILIDPDLGARDMTGSSRANIRWISSKTPFEWVRDFHFDID